MARARYVTEGFANQRIAVIPRPIVRRYVHDPMVSDLFPTDAGHFPHAANHRVFRAAGTPELVLIYCMRGKGWVQHTCCGRREGARDGFPRREVSLRGDRNAAVTPGSLVVLPPNQSHAYGADESDPWHIYWVHLVGKKVPSLMSSLAEPVVALAAPHEIGPLFEDVIGVLEAGYGPDQILLASSAAWMLCAHLLVALRRGPDSGPSSDQRVDTVIAHMAHHLTRAMRLDHLAAMANLSTQHFAEVFKRRTGFSPIDYFLRLRLRRAMEMVMTTEQPMKQIAIACGFESQLYFSRQFRRIYGSAPTRFRESKQTPVE